HHVLRAQLTWPVPGDLPGKHRRAELAIRQTRISRALARARAPFGWARSSPSVDRSRVAPLDGDVRQDAGVCACHAPLAERADEAQFLSYRSDVGVIRDVWNLVAYREFIGNYGAHQDHLLFEVGYLLRVDH